MTSLRFTPAQFDSEAWERMVAPFSDLGLTQCWAYGAARAVEGGWRVERGLVEDAGHTVAVAQVMVRRLPAFGGGLAWIGRGPLWRTEADGPDSASRFAAVLAAIRCHYVDKRGFYLRIAPPVAVGSPACDGIAKAGFRLTETTGWASAAIDLRRDADAIRARLDQKWRNGLNKAERLDVVVECGEDRAAFHTFVTEYRHFVGARGFSTTVTPALLEALQRCLPCGRKLVAYRALHDGCPLGSALIARYGRTAEYLAGTMPDAGRPFNVGQLLLWSAICDSKSDGFARFDVGGMDRELTPKGIFNFKMGMGGMPYQYVNEIEADDGGLRARLVRWRVARARAPLAAGSGA